MRYLTGKSDLAIQQQVQCQRHASSPGQFSHRAGDQCSGVFLILRGGGWMIVVLQFVLDFLKGAE